LSRVAIVFTGGTISMQPDPVAGGNRPVLSGAEILARSPRVAEIADVVAIDWGLVPASHLRFGQVFDIARVIRAQLDRSDIDGAVVVQGTDSIEETAFAFDLLIRSDRPVVVTGAMRDATSADYDGPANLRDAVACAIHPELRGAGALVVLGGSVIVAAQAVKAHATSLAAFRARDGQRLADVADGTVTMLEGAATDGQSGWGGWRPGLAAIPDEAVEDVYLVTAAVGTDGALIRGLAALRPRGLVVAATGSGNTSPDMLSAARELMDSGTMVCLTTRCPGGTVDPIYAFPGGGATWQQAGIMMSNLDGPKSRVALALGISAGLDRDTMATLLKGEGQG
jgi:L-asparaginase